MNKNEILRNIPQVNEILNYEELKTLLSDYPHDFIVSSVRDVLADIKAAILNGDGVTQEILEKIITKDSIVEKIISKVDKKSKSGLRRVINATGTVLHTNLGRSIISKKAAEDMMTVAYNYSNLEYDIKNGVRGDRQVHTEKLIKELTGAEACMVVNNNAAATIIVLAALARDKEVIISRGELIEIGGSFRIPEVMEESGAILKEVGATNKTKFSDYKNAYDEEKTAAILKVHTSNYKIVGFTEDVDINTLVPLGNELNLPVIYDMGNGLFVDLKEYGIDEPTVPALVKSGADVILFSGDKLLGGPQAGVIIGKEKYISKMKKHPLARAFRVDKFTIAALTATLFEYYDEKKAKKNVPILNYITVDKKDLKKRAESLEKIIIKVLGDKANVLKMNIEECKDQVGGGTAPDVYLDGYALSVDIGNDMCAEKVERQLRKLDMPIIARVAHNSILFDVRTVRDDEIELIANGVAEIVKDVSK